MEIRNQVEQIRTSGLLRYLQEEVREAHYQLEFIERMPHGRQSILDMDKKTMSEIRRYHNPPPALHKILQGAFLLLGEDEDTTDVSTLPLVPLQGLLSMPIVSDKWRLCSHVIIAL